MGDIDHRTAGFVIQFAVSGIRNGFFLHRRINDDLFQTGGLDQLARQTRVNRCCQQPLTAFLAQAVTPFGQGSRMAGKRMPEEGFTTEVLPVGGFQPVPFLQGLGSYS